MQPAYRYRAELVRVIDGDTIVVDLDLGLGVWQRHEHIRLLDLDTPEMRTVEGRKCRELLVGYLELCGSLVIETVKDRGGKYGRLLGRVHGLIDNEWHEINAWMRERLVSKVPFGAGE